MLNTNTSCLLLQRAAIVIRKRYFRADLTHYSGPRQGLLSFLKLPEKLSHETVTGSTLNSLAVTQDRYSVSLITTASPAPSASLISLSTTCSVLSPSLDNQKYRLVPYLSCAHLKYYTMRTLVCNVTFS